MQQKLIKVISALLVTTILYANSATLISYAADNFLSEKEIENQETATNNPNVEFDVYYDGGKHSATVDVNSTDTKLNLAINVKNAGYLKNAVVDFSDSNFTISQTEETDYIQNFDSEAKQITFNRINNGENALASVNIAADKKDEISEDMFKRDNNIKLTATYVNEKAEEIAIEKNIVIHTGWNAQTAKAKLAYEITKYIPYEANGVSKIITQGKVTSYVEDSILPIKETQIEITAPQINNEYPEAVTVVANSTNATNGDLNGEKFTTDNWSYDKQTGKISINVKNDIVDGKIKWAKDAIDEYIVTYIFSSDVYEAVKDSVVRVTYEAKAKMSLYGNGTGVTGVNASTDGYEDQTEKLGEIVEFKTETTEHLNKGYLYNNKNAIDENKKETEYKAKYTASISYADVIDSIELKLEEDQFVTKDGSQKFIAEKNANYKTLKISEKEFTKIFGETGELKLINAEGENFATINKSNVDDNGYITMDFTTSVNTMTIISSKPVEEGNITFEIIKVLTKDNEYSEEEIREFASIESTFTGIAKSGDIEIVNVNKLNSIILNEPTQKVNISINNDRLSTITKNENIEIKVTLENDSVDDIMYVNPFIRVDFPANIEKIDLKKTEIFFDNELKIKDSWITDNENGTKSLYADIEGTQTKFNNPAVQGATVVFTTDITLNKLTPTTNTEISVIAINGNEESTNATNKIEIKYIAPTGVVATNTMTGYNGNEILEAINGEAKDVLVPTSAEQKELTFTMNVINNYENTLSNVVVLGRTAFEGNKDVLTSQSLGSNITLPMTSEITVSGIDEANVLIYYSENGDATSDIENSSNGWKTTVDDYSKVKSYMIILNNYTMNTGTIITFTYKAMLPANLDYEQFAYENYAVYFNNNKPQGTIEDKVSATKIGIKTGSIAKLEAELVSKAGDGAKVPSGSKLEYDLIIDNKGSVDAEDVVIEIELPNGITYNPEENDDYEIKYSNSGIIDVTQGDYNITLEIRLGIIKANESITKRLTFETNITSESERTIQIKAKIKYANYRDVETNTVSNILTPKFFNIETPIKSTLILKEGDIYTYRLTLKSSEKPGLEGDDESIRKNSIVTIILPEELKYENFKLTIFNTETLEYDDITSSAEISANANIITVNVGDLDGLNGKKLEINTKIGTMDDNIYQKDFTIKATIQADGTPIESIDDVTDTINKAKILAIQTSNVPEGATISSAENYTYTFTLENLSDIRLANIKLVDYLSNGAQLKSLEVIYSDGTISNTVIMNGDGTFQTKINLEGKEKATINVNVEAKSLNTDTKITNKAKISHELIEEFETNEITHTIKKFEDSDINIDPGTGGDSNKKTKKIIGTIWIDENKDGIKDAKEQRVEGVEVILLDNSNGNIALDSNGEECIVRTGKDGAYMFNNIKPGKYTAIFFYDSSNYSATTYRKEGVSDSENSDAIDKTVIYGEKAQVAAVTEEIIVADENRYNIDLGIVEDPKFDLKLEKTVKSITVNDTKKTTEHVYNNKLAKIDFEAKYVASSSMVIEYKFTITNEGGIEGYVKKLADYLPPELKFNSELNKDWYEGKDGVIYNNSLANTLIKPGESKEVTLILTKNMNSEDFGLISNSAEIYEASNDYGILDIDSIPGNKSASEDDYSTADVLTSIKTGEIIIYTTLILTIITIVGVGTYIIKKKVLK